MDTLHVLICLFAGIAAGLVLVPLNMKNLGQGVRNPMSIAIGIVSAAILIVAGILLWFIWGTNAVAYLIGILMIILPYVQTPADRQQENRQ